MAPYNPPNTHYAQIDLPKDINMHKMKYIMGVKGYNLYNWTKKVNLDYVWIDFNKKQVELWGSYEVFANGAKKKLKNCIELKIKEYENKHDDTIIKQIIEEILDVQEV